MNSGKIEIEIDINNDNYDKHFLEFKIVEPGKSFKKNKYYKIDIYNVTLGNKSNKLSTIENKIIIHQNFHHLLTFHPTVYTMDVIDQFIYFQESSKYCYIYILKKNPLHILNGFRISIQEKVPSHKNHYPPLLQALTEFHVYGNDTFIQERNEISHIFNYYHENPYWPIFIQFKINTIITFFFRTTTKTKTSFP